MFCSTVSVPAISLVFFGLLSIVVFLYEWFVLVGHRWGLSSGVIIHSSMVEKFNKAHEKTGSALSYIPVVEYDFEVNGCKYTGDSVFVGKNIKSTNKSSVTDILKKYPEGLSVNVYYHEKNPSISCIEKKLHASSYLFLFLGGSFCLVGALIFSL